MLWRTASSNSMGPGINRAGCSAWFDMVAVVFLLSSTLRGVDRVIGEYGMSSFVADCRSVEKGVLICRTGLCSRCREIRDRRCLARGVARADDDMRGLPATPRQINERNAASVTSWRSCTSRKFSGARRVPVNTILVRRKKIYTERFLLRLGHSATNCSSISLSVLYSHKGLGLDATAGFLARLDEADEAEQRLPQHFFSL